MNKISVCKANKVLLLIMLISTWSEQALSAKFYLYTFSSSQADTMKYRGTLMLIPCPTGASLSFEPIQKSSDPVGKVSNYPSELPLLRTVNAAPSSASYAVEFSKNTGVVSSFQLHRTWKNHLSAAFSWYLTVEEGSPEKKMVYKTIINGQPREFIDEQETGPLVCFWGMISMILSSVSVVDTARHFQGMKVIEKLLFHRLSDKVTDTQSLAPSAFWVVNKIISDDSLILIEFGITRAQHYPPVVRIQIKHAEPGRSTAAKIKFLTLEYGGETVLQLVSVENPPSMACGPVQCPALTSSSSLPPPPPPSCGAVQCPPRQRNPVSLSGPGLLLPGLRH